MALDSLFERVDKELKLMEATGNRSKCKTRGLMKDIGGLHRIK